MSTPAPGPVPGDTVPDLPLELSSGTTTSTAAFRGRWLVLYFYPKDSTPGCTIEGRDFNSLLPDFRTRNAAVIGVSRDSIRSHQNFCARQGFGFELASDRDEILCRAFDVIREKTMFGLKVVGIERSTFLIDPEGRLAHVWRPVKVRGHAKSVLETLASLQAA